MDAAMLETRFPILLSSFILLFLSFLTAEAVRNDNLESREAAQECSPGRKPWVGLSS
jgi:hypothetical protein